MMSFLIKICAFNFKENTFNKSCFYFCSFFCLLFLSSCEEHGLLRKAKWVGIISNETNYDITISAYSRNVKKDSLHLGSKQKLTREFTERELGFTEGIFYFPEGSLNVDNRPVDSVVIVFERNKKIVHYCGGQNLANCDNIPKNLVSLWNQRNQIVDKDGNLLFGYLYKYQISFTKDDYNSAVPF